MTFEDLLHLLQFFLLSLIREWVVFSFWYLSNVRIRWLYEFLTVFLFSFIVFNLLFEFTPMHPINTLTNCWTINKWVLNFLSFTFFFLLFIMFLLSLLFSKGRNRGFSSLMIKSFETRLECYLVIKSTQTLISKTRIILTNWTRLFHIRIRRFHQ